MARALPIAPFAIAVLLLAAGAAVLERSSRINSTSPGGRYADPLAPATQEERSAADRPEPGVDEAYDWIPGSREAWSYRVFLARLGDLSSGSRLTMRVIGEAKYGRDAYPVVAATVKETSGGLPRVRVLLTSGVHGNERAGPEALMRFAELLSRSPNLYREVAFDIMPVVNPWGWVRGSRLNGAGKDINRDFASSNTQEADLVRTFVGTRISENGPYHIALDLHESSKAGYFVYQYTGARTGLGPAFARVVELAGRPLEKDYREGSFPVRRGVLSIPAISLPYVRALGRLSLEQYLRLSGTRHAYTLESPLSDVLGDRVRIHGEGLRAMLNAYLRQRGLAVEGRISSVSQPQAR